jgi:hypothetical protein
MLDDVLVEGVGARRVFWREQPELISQSAYEMWQIATQTEAKRLTF